ncbi:MAG: hypothetical protein NTW19_14430 [Planctomycetota bacterium]|nr:hypothetical protein [Planctomycetota bacterium]
MNISNAVRIAVFAVGMILFAAAPCVAEEGNYCWWRPTSLGIAPFRVVDVPAVGGGAPMRLEKVFVADKDNRYVTTVTSTGSQFMMHWPLICTQRIPIERDVSMLNFGRGGCSRSSSSTISPASWTTQGPR